MSPLLVLVGPPGSGKTTIGRLVADQRGVEFRDTDADIEQVAGKSVSDIFIEDGEPRFRELEEAAVRTALEEHDGVLAVGGGAVANLAVRTQLRDQCVIFLDVGLAAAAERVGFATSRPLLVVNPRAELKRLLTERRPHYEAVATAIVGTDDRSPEDVASDVVAVLEASP
jgi:shikimate kinase